MEWYRNLKTLREQNGYTQEQVAQAMNMTRSSVANWEVGKRIPKTKTLVKLSELYHVPIEIIYGSTDMNDIMDTLIFSAETTFKSKQLTIDEKDNILKKIMDIYLGSRKLQEVK